MSKVNEMNFIDVDGMDITEVNLTHRMTKEEIDSYLNPDKE